MIQKALSWGFFLRINRVWNLSTSIGELILRSTVVFIFLFLVIRIWGRKHLGSLSPFDFILLLIISEAVQNALVSDDKSVSGAMVTVITMILLNVVLNKLTFNFKNMEKLIDGEPIILIEDGKVDHNLLNSETVTHQELMEALRSEGVMEIPKVRLAVLETSGKISVVKKD